MKIKLLLCVVVVLLMTGGMQRADQKAISGFDQLKVLAGDWVGTTSEGKSGHVSYQVVSAGSALLERLQGEKEIKNIARIKTIARFEIWIMRDLNSIQI